MTKPIDLELKKAFLELQVKMVETSKKIQMIDVQIGVMKRVLHHADVTQQEISTLPPETKTYESVGRMFLLTDLKEIKQNLENRIAVLSVRTDELVESKQFLEMNLQESEDNIREMVQQRKEQGD
ncbi:prefoldin subunit 1 [Danaus plexippus]|uniref:Prefoldin subunit n=1 Tax=Danaus plexippus plexippus TaxID=278856 RepID=A0A212FHG9_DANPL|nr:prefoldin subunit 1 [Danaus plexippus]OWR53175.1 putative Prefoldin subunit [Danaus plexippus plexippus]